MSKSNLTIIRQQEQLGELSQLVQLRAQRETTIPQAHIDRDQQIEERYSADRKAELDRYRREKSQTQADYEQALRDAENKFDDRSLKIAAESDSATAEVLALFKSQRDQAKSTRNGIRSKAIAQFEREKKGPVATFARIKKQSGEQHQAIAAMQAEGDAVLASRRIRPTESEYTAEPGHEDGEPNAVYANAMTRARGRITQIEGLLSAKFIFDGWPALIWIPLGVACAVGIGISTGWSNWLLILSGGVGGGILIDLLLTVVVWTMARRQMLHLYTAFRRELATATASVNTSLNAVKAEHEPKFEAMVAHRNQQITTADETCASLIAGYEAKRDEALAKINSTSDQQDQTNNDWYQQQQADLNELYPNRLAQQKKQHQQNLADLDARREQQLAESQALFKKQWEQLVIDWHAGIAKFENMADEMNAFVAERFPPWHSIAFQQYSLPLHAPPAISIGTFRGELADFAGGLPQHDDLKILRTDFSLPALLTFPECPSLLLKAADESRDDAVLVMQNVMLRLLASMPAGKVKFTIVDPTGRGQNFSAFMHLADYDDSLVTSRIWTESGHINKRLTDITEHMENVIQKYLRNEFESIQQYNEEAGEVAEPYRVLVVANYPAGFSDEAAKRLVSIASSGARCGVSTVISIDKKEAAARKMDLSDLEAHAVTLDAQGDGQFVMQDEQLGRFALTIDQPPEDSAFTKAVKAIGQAAEDSSRVEVPFASIAPDDDAWWTSDSRTELVVPLGRAGATKLQVMKLGRGTSQHVLIAGKTGSGKSTLLNAMITNLAAYYSPDELEFYLIDFKKGVEFKPYATYKLPQAKVIAIESEREFGLSVLQRLDEELKRRGDLFRKAGVQDVKSWRDSHDDAPMPRILLVVDEFQELFVADDRVAREAGLLLDRLVRQGRAFGIHVMLGTQTLAGAYSLARSTIGQMAVRIALQCSESDAHLILSEDNTAARLLSRPGAAIYNDANGLVEGNNPFQVVWLPDHERESYLRQIHEMAKSQGEDAPVPIVFEGNIPSDPSDNQQLTALIERKPAELPRLPQAWLGASVAIKEPTFVTFDRHSGSNLLLVGQHEELAAGMLTTASVALAAHAVQLSSRDEEVDSPNSRFLILDGTRPDELVFGRWKLTARTLGVPADVFTAKQATGAIAEASAELARRNETGDDAAPPWYLVVFNLSRFRDLQSSGDDFGFTNFGEEEKVDPAGQFAELLRDGPAMGMHTIIWCDSYNNLNRWVDRQSLRDLELRVLLQMSATDSSNLIDSPAASQLGVNRAVLYNDERGEYEKFRPYGLPDESWLARVRKALGSVADDETVTRDVVS